MEKVMRLPFVRRVTIRNYKSIAACSVKLGPLMFLVGQNGSGKSNFLDVFQFVAEALATSLDQALRNRGTVKEVRRRSGGHPSHFAVRFDFALPNDQVGHYAFRIGAAPDGGYSVQREECSIHGRPLQDPSHHFAVELGKLVASSVTMPVAVPDRLTLVAASGLPEFRPVFDALSHMAVYNLDPRAIATQQRPDRSDILRGDGSNAASVLHGLSLEARQKVSLALAGIVPGLSDAEPKTLGSMETIEFRQAVKGQKHPWRFLADAMSDGTLRAFAILLAIFQAPEPSAESPLLIGLEEPEMALHPAAATRLLAALREAALNRQILVTSHSPDLLDDENIPIEALLAVDTCDGITRIGPIDGAGARMLKDHLFTPGELLRSNQLSPDDAALVDIVNERELGLFETFGR